jgi:RHS repeat-associated protein
MIGVPSADYDEAGNQKHMGGYAFVYDAESRVKESTISGETTSYAYDGEGRRVKKVLGSNTTVFVYDAAGQLAAEYSTGEPTEFGTSYLTADHLGSTRVVSDANGGVTERHDYRPFGEELFTGVSGRTSDLKYPAGDTGVRLKFTGKERDAETGLDYFGARYFSGTEGRFTSPDPKMFPSAFDDPQSWNKYAYTRNNPLRYIDPDGEDWVDIVKGTINAFTSDYAAGAGRIRGGNSDFRMGQAIGDALATVAGTAEALFGGGEAIVTSPAALTVAGAVVPAAGAATAVHGTTTAIIAGANLTNAALSSAQDRAPSSTGKPSLSDHKKALGKVHEEVGKQPKGEPGKFGSPQAGDSKKGYRLDPAHPNAKPGSPEAQTHINWWDFTEGKKNKGGRTGAEPVGPRNQEQY